MPLSNAQKQARYRAKQKHELQELQRKVQSMQLKAFSIRDSKGEIFHPPFYKKTHGEAERDFAQLVQDEKSTIAKFPEDFDLYFVGTYDDNSGLFSALDTPQHITKAVTVIGR